MQNQSRVVKTPERNLSDLDDHLYFLKEDLAKLIGGDTSYVKKIAAELRTLICLSSGTEGLLWRVAEQIEADDGLDLQATRGVDTNNPIVQGMTFLLVPVFRAGEGPDAFPPDRISFKTFIKEYEALYYHGQSYTHEKLIASIAQQMGVSHEGERVAPHLIDLSGVAVSNRPALVEFLITDANFALEIGERVLDIAKLKSNFIRRNRQPITFPPRTIESFRFVEEEHFQGRKAEGSNEGTQLWIISPPKPGWENDGISYNLGVLHFGRRTCTATKLNDGNLEINLYGIGRSVLIKRAPITSRGKPEIVVLFRWNQNGCKIYIDGKID